mgnify:CR=1 FL=1
MQVVSRGLKAGDRVITAGSLLLYPGAKVVTRQEIEQMRKGAQPKKPGDPKQKTETPEGAGKS